MEGERELDKRRERDREKESKINIYRERKGRVR
jgi:hypothetical protein